MTVEHQHGDVCKRAWAEAAGLREVDLVAELPALPFVVVELGRNSCVAVFGQPTATTGVADEEVPLLSGNVDLAPIGAENQVSDNTPQRLGLARHIPLLEGE